MSRPAGYSSSTRRPPRDRPRRRRCAGEARCGLSALMGAASPIRHRRCASSPHHRHYPRPGPCEGAPARSVDLGLPDDQRRQQPHGGGPGGVERSAAAPAAPGATTSGAGTSSSQASIRPRPRTESTCGRRSRPAGSRTPRSRTRASSVGVLGHLQRGERGGGDRPGPPAKVEPWSPGANTSARRWPVTSAPIGRPPPSALAVVIASGVDPDLLVGPQRAGAAHAALDLVEDQRRAVLVAGRARGDEHLLGEHVDAGLALDRLQQHGGGVRVDRAGERLGRRERPRESRARAARTAPAWTPGAWPTARRRCARERRCRRDDVPAGARLARELDRRLVGLGAGVAEVHLAAEAERDRRSARRIAGSV